MTTTTTTCKFCGMSLHLDGDTWVDDTEGDGCAGDDNLVNENESHVPEFKEAKP